MSNNNSGKVEYELDSKQCADIAYYMYQQYQEEMKPPVFAYYTFPAWLDRIRTLKKTGGTDEQEQ